MRQHTPVRIVQRAEHIGPDDPFDRDYGRVTGGGCFGYRNVTIHKADGRRSRVERQIDGLQAEIVHHRIFGMCAAGHGIKAIAKVLNAEGAPSPRAQQGRPNSWTPHVDERVYAFSGRARSTRY